MDEPGSVVLSLQPNRPNSLRVTGGRAGLGLLQSGRQVITAQILLYPLEKEFLIRRYRSNQRISIKDFCESNGITEPSLKKWMKQYDEGGLEGLARADAEIKEVLPEGVDRTEESYKREILKLRIENERLKKSYAVQTNADGEREYVRLKPKSLK